MRLHGSCRKDIALSASIIGNYRRESKMVFLSRDLSANATVAQMRGRAVGLLVTS